MKTEKTQFRVEIKCTACFKSFYAFTDHPSKIMDTWRHFSFCPDCANQGKAKGR